MAVLYQKRIYIPEPNVLTENTSLQDCIGICRVYSREFPFPKFPKFFAGLRTGKSKYISRENGDYGKHI